MTIGLRDLYYAICTEADGVETYGTPKRMAEAMTADLSVKTADGSLYADDTLSESVTEFASGTLKLGIKELAPEVTAEVLGQEVDQNKVVWAGKEDEPPYVAVGLGQRKSTGSFAMSGCLRQSLKSRLKSTKQKARASSLTRQTLRQILQQGRKTGAGKLTL